MNKKEIIKKVRKEIKKELPEEEICNIQGNGETFCYKIKNGKEISRRIIPAEKPNHAITIILVWLALLTALAIYKSL